MNSNVIYYHSQFCSETLSEAVKMLKGDYCVRAINKHKMDRAIIFCRTKLDCDNLEKYMNQLGMLYCVGMLVFKTKFGIFVLAKF